MKHYLSRHRIKILFIMLLFLSFCVLCSCGSNGNPFTMEEMQEKIMVRIYNEEIFYPYDFSLSPDETTLLPSENAETHTYRGVEYKMSALYATDKYKNENAAYSPFVFENTVYSHEKTCFFGGVAEDGSKFTIAYTNEWDFPLMYWNYEQPIYGDSIENPTDEDLNELCEDFVDDYINEKAKYSLDFSEYTLTNDTTLDNGTRQLKYGRFINGILAHKVTITLNKNHQIIGYFILSTPLEEKVYRQIPELTEEQWAEMARPAIEKAYQNSNIVINNITDLKTRKTLTNFSDKTYDFNIYYDEESFSYCIYYSLSMNVEYSSGKTEKVSVVCSYPIYTPEQED